MKGLGHSTCWPWVPAGPRGSGPPKKGLEKQVLLRASALAPLLMETGLPSSETPPAI